MIYCFARELQIIIAFIIQVTPQDVKRMEREKHVIEGQLRDLEWRLDQESKVHEHTSTAGILFAYVILIIHFPFRMFLS